MKLPKEYLTLLAAALCYSTLAIFSELLTRQGVDPFNQVFWRVVFAGIICLGITLFKRINPFQVKRRELKYLLVNAMLMTFGFSTFTLAIYYRTPVLEATVLSYAYPLTAVVLAYLLLKERPTINQVISLCLSLVSVMILLQVWNLQNLGSSRLGDLFALANSVCYGSQIVWSRVMQRRLGMDRFQVLFLTFGLQALMFVTFAHVLGLLGINLFLQPLRLDLSLATWLTEIGLAFIGTVLSISLIYKGVAKVKPHVASILLLTEPIWVYIMGVVLFNQNLSLLSLIGVAGIIIALLLI